MRAWIGMAAIAAAVGAAAPAGAQCLVFEGDVPSGPPDLAGASDVAVNPDGASVYAVALSGDALNVFTRDPATGAVTYFSQFNDGVSGVDGLDVPRTVTVSPDGKHVYVGSDDGVAVFREMPSSVQLQYVELHGAPEIDMAIGVAVSRDGKHVYVADSNGSRIAIYTRDATTGALDFVTYFADGQDGALLFGVQDVAVAPDGSQVYAVSGGDNAFLLFGRDPATGLLDLARTAATSTRRDPPTTRSPSSRTRTTAPSRSKRS
jgi:6-phosphogluconolactonase (cycloisomerase 2 family)